MFEKLRNHSDTICIHFSKVVISSLFTSTHYVPLLFWQKLHSGVSTKSQIYFDFAKFCTYLTNMMEVFHGETIKGKL